MSNLLSAHQPFFTAPIQQKSVSIPLSPLFLFGLTTLLLIAGGVNGLAGFGFAVVGTMALAIVVDPAMAVVFMILPIFAVNLSLVSELDYSELKTCGRRFGPLIGAALIGTIIGMFILDVVPDSPLRILLGLVSLAFVATVQQWVELPSFERLKAGCFVESVPAMIGFGSISGLLFGGTNVGVQLVAYVKSFSLPHGLFVGVVAMVFLGLNGVRIVVAGAFGLYPDLQTAGLSVGAVIPAVIGAAIGSQFREAVSEATIRIVVLGLLTIIGIQLLLTGFELL